MKLNPFKWLLLFAVVSLFSLVGCQANSTPLNTITPPPIGNTESRELPLTSTPSEVYQYPTLSDVLKDKNYLRDCREKYPPVYTGQFGFRGIYPGVTTSVDLKKILGEPDSYIETGGNGGFGYSDIGGYVSIKNLVVDGINIDPKSEGLISLQLVLETYGCPDVINAKALIDDPFDTSVVFNKTFLWYMNAGIWVSFEKYPIKYSQSPSAIGFERPSFLYSIVGFDERSKPVSFAESVDEK